jgi:uncharacterized membrane protein
MAHTIIGIFDNVRGAQRAAGMLQDTGLALDDLSVLSRHDEGSVNVTSAEDLSSSEGATLGAVWGGIVGLGSLLIPGVGPIVAGGALASALTGAGVGAVTGAAVGGVAAALIHVGGISEAEAKEYEALVHSGKTLVAAKVRPEQARHVYRILIKAGAESVEGDTAAPGAPAVPVAPAVRVTTYDVEGQRVEHAPE